jgi:hypothetical protein
MKPIPEMPTRNMSLFQGWLGRKARSIDLGIDDFLMRRGDVLGWLGLGGVRL